MEQALWEWAKDVAGEQAVWAVRALLVSAAIVCAQNAVIANRTNEAFPVCRKNVRIADQL